MFSSVDHYINLQNADSDTAIEEFYTANMNIKYASNTSFVENTSSLSFIQILMVTFRVFD